MSVCLFYINMCMYVIYYVKFSTLNVHSQVHTILNIPRFLLGVSKIKPPRSICGIPKPISSLVKHDVCLLFFHCSFILNYYLPSIYFMYHC